MRHSKIFRILALVVILCLLVIAIPATPALAAVGIISIYPTTGPIGTTVTISGSRFTPSSNYTVTFGASAVVYGVCDLAGNFYTTFTVPSHPRGQRPVSVTTSALDTSNTVFFTVTPQITTLSPTSGYVGDTVSISGTGFATSSSVTIYFDNVNVGTTAANASGIFSGVTFTVPESCKGNHTVKAADSIGYSPGVSFTTNQSMSITPTSGAVGDQITISGTGFAASKSVTFYIDDVVATATATTTGANGSFTNNTFTIPPTSSGIHTIKAKDASDNFETATFTVGHKMSITPTAGITGDTVTVTGNGFGASKVITIKYDNIAVTTTPSAITTNVYGAFTGSFNVPAGAAGTHLVEISDGTYSASADFVTTTEVTINQTTSEASPGYVGDEFTISGTGLKPDATVTITYTTDPVVLATVTTDEKGAFSATVTIPASPGGNHTITVTDGLTTKQFAFVMESEAPPIPPPLLPLMGEKAEEPVHFDWKDVDDPSKPVMYTFQLASDAGFENMVLEKELTGSEYTLTEAEKLESTGKDAPYYWRIRATDSASNVSDWTGAGTFYTGFTFELKGWILYALMGAGGLLLFFLGMWVGRRTFRWD